MKRFICFCPIFLSILSGCVPVLPVTAEKSSALMIFTEEYAPLNFTEDGKITGQATEIIREMLKRTATEEDIRMVSWGEGYQAVLEKPDTALYSTVMTPERKGRFQWVGPIGTLDTNFYALRGSGIKIANLEEAKRIKNISTVKEYYSDQSLKKEGFKNLESCASEEVALRKMLAGESQLFVSTNTVMPALLKKVGANMDKVERVFTLSMDLTYVAFSLDTPAELVATWQKALDGMKQDGTFQKIYAQWLPTETPPGRLQMMTEEYPPITFMSEGKPAGFVTEMVREIAARQNVPVNIRLTSWKNAYNMALLHPNVVLFSAERTAERDKLFQWVGPVGKNSAIFYARKGSDFRINHLEDARKLTAIATTTNWFTEQLLKGEGFTNLLSSPDPSDNVKQLMEGEAQLAIFTDITVPQIVKNAGYSMDDLKPVFTVTSTNFYIAMSNGTPAAEVQGWQSTLEGLKKDGTFEKIYRSYLRDVDLEDLLK